MKGNNLKTSVLGQFKKNRKPKGYPESRLGVMIHPPKYFQKKIRYIWSYRNLVLSDALHELPRIIHDILLFSKINKLVRVWALNDSFTLTCEHLFIDLLNQKLTEKFFYCLIIVI